MKSFFQIILLIGISFASLPAQQTSWQWVSPLPQGNILNGIWTIDQDTIYAVGDYGTILKSTNKGLTWQVTPNATGIVEPLFAVQFISGSTGWIVGEYGRILKTIDGGATWFLQEASIPGDLYALYFISSTTGWVVGSQGKAYKTTNGGTTWTPLTTGTTAALYSIQFLSSTTGWIAGTNGTILGTTDGGTIWSKKTTPTPLSLYGIQFTSSTVGYAAGAFGTILKTTNGGTTWIQQVSSTDFSLFAMHFTSSLIGWVSGVYGVIMKTTNGGLSWFEQSSPTYNDLYSIKFANSSYGWGIGDFGTIVATTDGGMTWIQQSTGTATELYGISFPSPTYGIAVGDEGLIVRSVDGGKSWVQQPSGSLQPLYGVHMVTDLIGWAVGDSAVILRTTNSGQSWVSQNSRNDITLYSVFFINTTTGWTVGDFGTILGTVNGGVTWKAETTNTFSTPLKIKFINPSIGWSVGYGGLILKTTNGGIKWNEQASNTYQTLYSLDIIDANHVVACGDFGTIVTTSDGGETWVDNSTGLYESFYGVAFSTLGNGWCVGDDGVISNTTDGGITWNLLNSGTYNTLWDLQLLRSGTGGGTLYAAGIGGTILVAGITPLPIRTWTGISDSNWTSPGNWNPYGAPQNGDSLYIPQTAINPVLRTIQQQINVSALHIGTGAKLTLAEGLSQLVVSGPIKIEGTFEVRPKATTEIISGGTFSIGPFGRFYAGRSSLTINTLSFLKGNYYNLYLLTGAVSQSVGNIEITNNLTTLSNLTLRQVDTLTIFNPNPQGLQGQGIISGGTIKRPISSALAYEYRFESPVTYLKFYPRGTLPDTVLMTSYPNTLGPGLSDSVFVRRYYAINAKGGSNYLALLSLRYDTSETTISIDNIALFRDSSGIIKNVGVTDFLDSDMVAISLDSVSRFSRWYLGYYDFYPKHPLEFSDSLIITDAGMVTDTIVFGTYPGATNGIDTLFGEYELLPIPPAGTFDVRWSVTSTNGTNIDIRNVHSPTNLEIIYTCLIQPSTAGYPVTLRWDKNVFPIGTVLLQDQATGGGIFSIDMKNQSAYTITNPAIRVVQISYKAPRYYAFPAGWDMISIPVTPTGNRKKISIFPNAISGAFGYNGLYYEADSLTNGVGYWLKLAYQDTVGIEGLPLSGDTLSVNEGWNMIGSISEPIGINQIISIPANLTSSDYYFYNGGYQSRDTILPARAYWIKTKSAGSLILSTDGKGVENFSAQKLPFGELNTLTISDASGGNKTLYFSEKTGSYDEALGRYELPPPPPFGGFDARFTSGRYVEELPKSSGSLFVKIQSESYPVTIQWKTVQASDCGLRITDMQNHQLEQSPSAPGEGWVRILDPEARTLRIEVVPVQTIPQDFALRQNYPNPFNPSTLIEFGLPAPSAVTLKIYNILGEEIATIINDEMLEAGIHKRSFDMQNNLHPGQLSSGIYFYRLNAKSANRVFSDIKKMILIK